MWSKEKISDTLNNSRAFNVAGLMPFHVTDNFYIGYSDMNQKSAVFPCQIYKFSDKFVINSSYEKERLSYEYSEKNDSVIECLRLENYDNKLEILVTNDLENQERLSIAVSDNFQKKTYLLKISNQSFSLSMDCLGQIINLDYEPNKENKIRYEEVNKNDNLIFEINCDNQGVFITCNGKNTFLTNSMLSDAFADFTLNYYLNLFFHSQYIQSIMNYIINKIDDKVENLHGNISKFSVYEDLSVDKSTSKSDFLKKLLRLKLDINDILEKSKVVNIEEENQKRLRI